MATYNYVFYYLMVSLTSLMLAKPASNIKLLSYRNLLLCQIENPEPEIADPDVKELHDPEVIASIRRYSTPCKVTFDGYIRV